MKKLVVILASIILSVTLTFAQATGCPVDYAQALSQTQEACDETDTNHACYGNNTINLVPYETTSVINFDSPGDVASVEEIRALSLSALDESTGDWGIAMLRLLANLSPSEADNVTLLLFGDVEIETAMNHANKIEVVTNTYANVRRYPNTTAPVMVSVAANKTVYALGRLADNSWVQIIDQETNIGGWVFADLLYDFDIEQLDILPASQPYFGPMQAFYYTGKSHDNGCSSVPTDGLLIQTPEGVGRVTIWVNEVTIDFMSDTGATAYLNTEDDESMTVEMVEGEAYIGNDAGGYVAVAGSAVSVKPGNDGESPKVNAPTPSNQWSGDNSAIDLLDREVDPSQPANTSDIASSNNLTDTQYEEVVTYGYVLTQNESSPDATATSTPASSTTADVTVTPVPVDSQANGNFQCEGRGNSCNAPGQSGDKSNNGKAPDKSNNGKSPDKSNNGQGNN